MNSDIFVNKNGLIEVYFVEIDVRKLEMIQSAIDEWNKKTKNFLGNEKNRKVEVIFERMNDDGILGFCNPIERTYPLHPLSDLCNFILLNSNSFDLSERLKCLLEWSTTDLEEMKFVREILSAMTFQKIDTKFIDEKRIKSKLGFSFLNRKMDEKLRNMGFFDSSFYAKAKSDECLGKRNVRKKVLSSLPLAHYFE